MPLLLLDETLVDGRFDPLDALDALDALEADFAAARAKAPPGKTK